MQTETKRLAASWKSSLMNSMENFVNFTMLEIMMALKGCFRESQATEKSPS